jgi:hypothetical protein
MQSFDSYLEVPEVREFRRIDAIAAWRLARKSRPHATHDGQQYTRSH